MDPLPPLSSKQQEAVTHGDGPLLIIAGAGTGKTLVITRRIAHLVLTKKAKPHEILALTFTEKAAKEMEERVDLLVPYGYTDLTISTFHAFGDRLLREHGLRLGLSPDFRVLSRPEQIIFIQKHLFDFPLSSFRPLGNPTKHIEAILGLISRAKDEDIHPDTYLAYAQQLKNTAAENKGDPSLLREALIQMDLAQTYRSYQECLTQEGYIDFGDQVFLAVQLLRGQPDILKRMQDKIRYLLVDEFQDTNYAQFQLVQLLGSRFKNITVVGDDDQSIYKFRGAAISNIMGFRKVYPEARKIFLTENFRSVQPILDAAYRLIQRNNPDRLEVQEQIDKRLIFQGETPDDQQPPITHVHFDCLDSEADRIARCITEQIASGGRKYRDFAILVRANADADPYLRALNLSGIPYRFSGNLGLYRRPEVRLLIAFLRSVADFRDSSSLYYLASSELYRVPVEYLSYCMNLARRRNSSLYEIVSSPEAKIETSEAAIHQLVEDLKEALRRSRDVDAGVLLYEFIRKSGLLTPPPEQMGLVWEMKIKNIARFFSEIKRLLQFSETLHDVVWQIDLLLRAGHDPPSSEADEDANSVSVLTVHKAKGLEFDTVFMVGLAEGKFPSRKRGETLELPLALIQEEIPEGDVHIQEERRLFYVGMTRARRALYLTSARDIGTSRDQKVSPFVLEALNLPLQAVKTVVVSPHEAIARHGMIEKKVEPVHTVKSDEPRSLTYYQIDDYLTCPLKYKYSHILKVPIYQHHSVIYGSAMHQAVAAYLMAKRDGQQISFPDMLAVFQRAWRGEGFLSREHEEQRFAEGHAVLRRFYDRHEATDVRPTHIEKEFYFFFENIRITGRWDRCDDIAHAGGKRGIIIDYKTSETQDQKGADKKTKESLQLSLYAWAYAETFGQLPIRVELHFLGSGLVGTAVKGEKELGEIKEKVRTVAAGIGAGDFLARPTYMACRYCAYQDICPYTAQPV